MLFILYKRKKIKDIKMFLIFLKTKPLTLSF